MIFAAFLAALLLPERKSVRYLLAVVVWLVVCGIWGLVGTMVGPGIVMLIIALMVGAVGSLLTVTQYLCGFKGSGLYNGVAVATCSAFLAWLMISNNGLTYWAVLLLAIFIALPSFFASFLVNQFREPD